MKVSIVTTAYNVEPYIDKCVKSILAQSHKDFELIIVNDSSTDNTEKKLNKIKDERIRIITHEKNMGAGQARRTGIEAATGDYVITVDGDDWLSVDFIEKLAHVAEVTDADIVSGGITIVWDESYEEVKRFLPRTSEGIQKFVDYKEGKIIFLNNKLVRREMYDLVPYCTRRYCEDTPVALPLLYYANKVVYADTQGYYYRQHEQSLCRRVNQFEEALYKALCSRDCIQFFATKEDEYKGIVSVEELVQYIHTLKHTINGDMLRVYASELLDLLPVMLQLIPSEKKERGKTKN